MKLTWTSTCRRAADGHALAGHHITGSVQAGDGQCQPSAKRDVAAGAIRLEEQAVVESMLQTRTHHCNVDVAPKLSRKKPRPQ